MIGIGSLYTSILLLTKSILSFNNKSSFAVDCTKLIAQTHNISTGGKRRALSLSQINSGFYHLRASVFHVERDARDAELDPFCTCTFPGILDVRCIP